MRLYKVNRVVWNNMEEDTERETTYVVADDTQAVLDELDDPYTQEIEGIELMSYDVRVHEPDEKGNRGE